MWLSLRFREAASVAEHRELGIPIRHGRGRHKAEQFYVRFCFPHATAADAFRDRFGGERLRYTSQKPESRARVFDATERRIISTRIADAQVSPGGAKRDPSHKHMSLSTDHAVHRRRPGAPSTPPISECLPFVRWHPSSGMLISQIE